MSENENVEFKISLSSTWHNSPPKFSLLLNDELIESGEVSEKQSNDETKIISFSKELPEGEHTLKIRLLDKRPMHTLIDAENNILADQILHIEQIELDEIELDYLYYSLGKYHKQSSIGKKPLEYNEQPLPDNYKDLGFNGEWRLTFNVPTYIWFLENL